MDAIKQPDPLSLEGNVDYNWATFKQRFDNYLTAIDGDSFGDARKVALLLTCAGPAALELYNTFDLTEANRIKYKNVVEAFVAYCSPKKNETYERYLFRSRLQKPGENFDMFYTDLKLKAKTCKFDILRDSMIRDQIVFGISDHKTRERLLRETDVTLDKAVKICQSVEAAQRHLKVLDSSSTEPATEVAYVNHKKTFNSQQGQKGKPKGRSSGKRFKRKSTPTACTRCGNMHEYNKEKCAAYGKTCSKCGRPNHFAHYCRTSTSSNQSVAMVKEDSLTEDFDDFFINTVDYTPVLNTYVTPKPNEHDPWTVPLEVNNTVLPLVLDTGAKANLITKSDFISLKVKPKVLNKTINLTAYNGTPIQNEGLCRLSVCNKGKTMSLGFVIVPQGKSLLGCNACEKLNLIQRMVCSIVQDDSLEVEQDHTPDKVGTLPFEYHIQLKEDSKPVVHPPRRVPVPLKAAVKIELDRMVKMGIIEKTNEPTDWVNSMVVVKKSNGKLRICIDPKDLNKCIKRQHHYLPTREDISSDMAGAQYFSKLDLSHGFWQIPLSKESYKLCCFNSPFGRFNFKRLPFGLCSAPEVFQAAMERVLEGLEGVKVVIDDILIWGKTKHEHDARLKLVKERVKQYGLKLNPDKCHICTDSITFVGDRYSAKGIEPMAERIEAISNMPRPQDKKAVQRILGVFNYVGKFIPNLSKRNAALRTLLEDKVEWSWGPEHEKEWLDLKECLIQSPVLAYFDAKRETKVSADASKNGIGAVLLQKHDEHWRPVAYAARSMTSCEVRYAQIEKECLGLAYACERFDEYIYGLPTVQLETDHKPLIPISQKSLNDMPARVQRLMIKIQRYDVELVYTPGKYLNIPDTLSRAGYVGQGDSLSNEVKSHVNMVYSGLPVSQEKLQSIAEATEADPVLKVVLHNLEHGWEKGSVNAYYTYRDELCVVNGILLRGERIVIPTVLRKEILARLHEGHLGVEKIKSIARNSVFWPNISVDIDRIVSECSICQSFKYNQQRENLKRDDEQVGPWEKVGTDLFEIDHKMYLLVIDYYSNYPEVVELKSTTSTAIIKHLKSIFSRHGIPQSLVSDNGPQYDSREFKEFVAHYGFKHVTSSPNYPQSNGKAEKGVQIVKRLIMKASESRQDPELALLQYRSAPLACGRSPAELLFNRVLNTRVPRVTKIDETDRDQVSQRMKLLQDQQKFQYNKSAKDLPPLYKNDVVRLRFPLSSKRWNIKAKVVREVAPRSYEILTERGQVLRRNRRHLLIVKEQFVDPKQTFAEDFLPNLLPLDKITPPVVSNSSNTPAPPTPAVRRTVRVSKPPSRLIESI